jgi:hypothetical protein
MVSSGMLRRVALVVVLLYCVCALFVCNLCYLSVVLLYYCHRAEAQFQFNKYIYIYIRTEVSEELSASFIRVTRIDELGTSLAVTSNRRTLRRSAKSLRCARRLLVTARVVSSSSILVTLMKEALSSSET